MSEVLLQPSVDFESIAAGLGDVATAMSQLVEAHELMLESDSNVPFGLLTESLAPEGVDPVELTSCSNPEHGNYPPPPPPYEAL